MPTPIGTKFRPYLLSVDEYYRLIQAGVFGEDDPVYLWKGGLVKTMTKGRPHTIALTELYERMIRLVPGGWYVEQEQPLALGDDSLPEPDLTVIRGTPRDYPTRSPTAKDVALVVEVADTSLAADQGEVLEAYAKQAIPIYWIVNIPKRRIEVYSDPTGPSAIPSYRSTRYFGPDDEVPVVIDGREVARIPVKDLLP